MLTGTGGAVEYVGKHWTFTTTQRSPWMNVHNEDELELEPMPRPKRCPDCLNTPGRYQGLRDAGVCKRCKGSAQA